MVGKSDIDKITSLLQDCIISVHKNDNYKVINHKIIVRRSEDGHAMIIWWSSDIYKVIMKYQKDNCKMIVKWSKVDNKKINDYNEIRY
jgi:hypothetical protein